MYRFNKTLASVLAFVLTASMVVATDPTPPPAPTPPRPVKAIPLKLEGDTITVVQSFPLLVTAPPGFDWYIWSTPDAIKAEAKHDTLVVRSAPKGKHRVTVLGMSSDYEFDKEGRVVRDKDGKPVKKVVKDQGEITFIVGGVDPVPPTPDPNPPGPTPTPDDAPIKLEGLRVLVVEESADRGKLPASQVNVIQGQTVRSYLNGKCARAADGKTAEWWILDKDVDASGLAKHWQDALARSKDKMAAWKPDPNVKDGPKQALPWVLISNGKSGYEGPLPRTPSEMVELLKRYGG